MILCNGSFSVSTDMAKKVFSFVSSFILYADSIFVLWNEFYFIFSSTVVLGPALTPIFLDLNTIIKLGYDVVFYVNS